MGHPDMHLPNENEHQSPAEEQLVVSDRHASQTITMYVRFILLLCKAEI